MFATMNENEKMQLAEVVVNGIDDAISPPHEAVQVADALGGIESTELLTMLHAGIRSEYERVTTEQDPQGIAAYGLLVTLIGENATTDLEWFKSTAAQFQVDQITETPIDDLANGIKMTIQQHYFYNDADGISSFNNFQSHFKFASGWKWNDNYSYVMIESSSGEKVQIYANKPEFDLNGIHAIDKELESKGYEPTVIVHRGHSFHTEKTLVEIPESAVLIILGSCGGYYKVDQALQQAPGALIISSRQIGTMHVNDPLIKMLNEEIRAGKNIVWPEFWDEATRKLSSNRHFNDYVPPHKNIGAAFIKAYYQLLGV